MSVEADLGQFLDLSSFMEGPLLLEKSSRCVSRVQPFPTLAVIFNFLFFFYIDLNCRFLLLTSDSLSFISLGAENLYGEAWVWHTDAMACQSKLELHYRSGNAFHVGLLQRHTHFHFGLDLHTCGGTKACRRGCKSVVKMTHVHSSFPQVFSQKHPLVGLPCPEIFPHHTHTHTRPHKNNIATYILAAASRGSTSHQSSLSSVPPHCHHPITSSQSHESTNQHRPGAVQILLCSCWQKINCKERNESKRVQ